MTHKILVTYASRAGSTAEVAQAIGKILCEEGVQVDVLPMQVVKDLSNYQAIIAGSAIRKSRWLPEAIQFIRAHQGILRHKSFAMFTVCITLAMSNSDQSRSAVAGWVSPVRAMVRPLSEGLFAGMLDQRKLPYTVDELAELAQHCTDQEDAANKVERHVRKAAGACLLSGQEGEHFDGVVTGAADKGTWVRIFRPPIEGKLVRGQQGLDIGDRVRVKLLGVDVERGFIDFARR